MKRRTTVYWTLLAFVAPGALSSGCSTVTGDGKSTSTITAVGAINDQVEKGNVEIEGDTDTAPLP
ncbi:MAG: hypothetical protein WBG92_17085 [Thiohalocapsa sp.]